jgi:hypothetical protein
MDLNAAQGLVLGAWCAVGLVLIGWGALVRWALGARAESADDWLTSFWIGWCALVLALQVWHLAMPVGQPARIACAAIGAIGLVVGVAQGMRWPARAIRHVPALVGVAVVAVWVSNHALAGARHGDSGAYFLPTVHWYVTHRIVPGLGNLHGHFALNQSYFLYVAALEAGPFAGGSFHLANGMLILMLAVRMVLATERLLRLRRAARLDDLYYALMAPGTLALVVSIFCTSPSPDVAIFALGTVCSGELIGLLADDPVRRVGRLRIIVLLAITGVTVKLSLLGFAAALLVVAAGVWWVRDRPPAGRLVRELGVATLIGLAAFGPWIARNIIMSGFPLFPSAAIVLPVEWRVQTDVEGWLRNSVHPAGAFAMFTQPRWFLQMLVRQEWNAPDVVGPLAVACAGLMIGLLRRVFRRGAGTLSLAAMLPALASLLFCLMLSPVPRYAGATMWMLCATGVLVAVGDRLSAARALLRPVTILAAVAATVLVLRAGMNPLWMALHDFEHMGLTRYEARRLESGLVVNVPTVSDACWLAPLPCTGYPNPALRLRREGDLASGFMLDPVLHERFPYEPGAAWVSPPARPR